MVASATMLNPRGDVVISVSSRRKFALSKHQAEISGTSTIGRRRGGGLGGNNFSRRFRRKLRRFTASNYFVSI